MFNRNLIILLGCQLIGTSASTLMIIVGGVIGADLAPSKMLATLPVTMVVLGTATSTLPVSLIMQKVGRSFGFSLAALAGAIALSLCAGALLMRSFALYCFGSFLFGFSVASVMQYRFCAAESVKEAYVSKAISLVLFGSIGGAFVGSSLVRYGAGLYNVAYVGSLIATAILLVLSAGLLVFLEEKVLAVSNRAKTSRQPVSIKSLLRKRVYLLAVCAGVAAQGIMVLIMTATPISMHVHHGHSMNSTSLVIQSHVLAMYLPSLFSGYLISWLGVKRLMIAGCVLFFAMLIAGFFGHTVKNYWITLVLLGVGWNFLFVAGTTLLTSTYAEQERFIAQGANDFVVFGGSATASLLAGTMLHFFGWESLLIITTPILCMVLFFIVSTKINVEGT